MKVLILAGGFATRLWPLTENRAKPLLLLGGKTILHRMLDQVLGQQSNRITEQQSSRVTDQQNNEDEGCIRAEDVIILTNKKFEQDFRNELEKSGYEGVDIFIEDAESDGQKKGALGAVWDCINHYKIEENVAILAGDNVIPGFSIEQLFCSDEEAKILVKDVFDFDAAKKFGVVEMMGEKDGKIESEKYINLGEEEKDGSKRLKGNDEEVLFVKRFEEKPSNPKSTLVSTGFVCLGRECFPVLEEWIRENPDNLGGVFSALLEAKKTVLAEVVNGAWYDVGSFETYLEAHRELDDETAEQLNEGSIGANNSFSGAVYVGDGCAIENCTLIDCIVYPGTRLFDCRLANCVIDSECDLSGVDLCGKLVRGGTKVRS